MPGMYGMSPEDYRNQVSQSQPSAKDLKRVERERRKQSRRRLLRGLFYTALVIVGLILVMKYGFMSSVTFPEMPKQGN